MKSRRQARIIELINEYPIETQEELIQRLRSSGFNVTQATVSRDIKELRLLKSLSADGKYRYTTINKGSTDVKNNVQGFFKSSVVSIKAAQNIIVVKTLSGMAQAVCASFDNVGYNEVLGTIAGDDTIFIVCSDLDTTQDLFLNLKKYME
jgi:transcriptional regulator of arginine metabolism